MIDIILLGLTSLTSITGFASGLTYNLTNEDVQIISSYLESNDVLNKDGSWIPETNLLTEIELSTDRTKQGTYTYSYIGSEIKGIRIEVTDSAVGNRNLSRISIGNLKLMYEAQ